MLVKKSLSLMFFIIFYLLVGLYFMFGPFSVPKEATLALSNVDSGSTEYEFENVPIERVEIVSDSAKQLMPCQSADLGVVLTPSYAIATAQNISYEIKNGTTFAKINKNSLTVLPTAPIGGIITVSAIADGIPSFNTLTFTVVKIPIESVQIMNTEVNIEQGGVLQLEVNTYPQDATYKNVKYVVIDGGQFVSIIGNGVIRVNNDLPAGDLTVKVRVSSTDDSTMYDEITFKLYVPVREIVLGSSAVTEVEQRQSYSFNCAISPLTASMIESGIEYSLDVDKSIAEIDRYGLLIIGNEAPIGSQITITMNGPDGISASHTVTVVAVYATEIRLDEVRKENGTAVISTTPIYPGDKLFFDIAFPTPFNVTEQQKTFSVSLVDGDTEVLDVVENSLIIKPIGQIVKKNPTFTVQISSVQGEILLTLHRTFVVYIPVTEVNLIKKEIRIDEGVELPIESILSSQILPENSNIQNEIYTITFGNTYAEIIDNQKIKISKGLEQGNLTFKIKAISDGVESNEVLFSIYVKTSMLRFEADNMNPMSEITTGETVNLTAEAESKATNQTPSVSVIHGAELIDGGYKNGDSIPLSFKIKANLRSVTNLDKKISLKAEGDEIVRTIDIIVHIPSEEINIVSGKFLNGNSYVRRGTGDNPLYLSHNMNDDYQGIEILSITTETGLNILGDNINLSGSMKLKVPKFLTAGTVIMLKYKANDKLKKEFSATFVVEKLDDNVFMYAFSKDSEQVALEIASPQLFVGRYVDITAKYNGEAITDYGLFVQNLSLMNGSAGYSEIDGMAKIERRTNDTVRLFIDQNASGKAVVYVNIVLKDGVEAYIINLPAIKVFKPVNFDELNIKITAADTVTMEVGDEVYIKGWNSTWTADEDKLVWENVVFKNEALTDEGTLDSSHRVTGTAPSRNFTIKINLRGKQKYNGQYLETLDILAVVEKQFNFTGIEYRTENDIVKKRVWKRWIEGTTTKIAIDNPLETKSGLLSVYQTESNTYKEESFNYVQTGWVAESNDFFTFGFYYTGNISIILKPKWIAPKVTQYMYEGAIKVEDDNVHVHTNEYTLFMDINRLKVQGYTEIRIDGQYEIRADADDHIDGQQIWLDINKNVVWSLRFTLETMSWCTKTFSTVIDISNFTEQFTLRFGFRGEWDGGWFESCDWWFNEGSVTFTAIKGA